MNHSSLKASSVPAGVSCWISSHRCSTSCVGPIILACCNSLAICVTLCDPVCDPVTICVASRFTLWNMLLCSGWRWWWCVRLILVATLWPSVWHLASETSRQKALQSINFFLWHPSDHLRLASGWIYAIMNFTTYSCESTKLVRSLTWKR